MGLEAKKRIVITGLGTINPLGKNVEDFWRNLIDGKSGISRISKTNPDDPTGERLGRINTDVDIAGQVLGFDPKKIIPSKELLRMHRVVQFATIASLEAMEDAGFVKKDTNLLNEKPPLISLNPKRFGARWGTGVGGGSEIAEIEDIILEKGDTKISSRAMLKLLSERAVTVQSRLLNIKGPVSVVVAACASSAIAIGDAVDKLLLGKADVMLAGGSEAAIHRIGIGAFNAMQALSRDNDNPTYASRPFNKNVNGFVMGEGAATLVLETLEHAQARDAENHIYAEFLGHADTADADDDVQPNGEGAFRSMALAIADAGIKVPQLDYINTHGTSTPVGDKKEIEAILKLLGRYSQRVSVSSTKGGTAHLLGAAGATEALVCCKAIQEQIVPPTINLTDPIVDNLDLVPNTYKVRIIHYALSNSFAFGGICSSLVFGKYPKNEN